MNTFKGKFYSAMTDENKNLIVSFAVLGSDIYPARECLNTIKELKSGGKELLTVEFSTARNRRSLNANAYFHVLITEMARVLHTGMEDIKHRMVHEYGVPARDENGTKIGFKVPANVDVHTIYKYAYHFGESTANGINFNHYIVYKQTHELNTAEMSKLIEGVIRECKELGIETQTPEQTAKMLSLWEKELPK